MLIEIIGYLQLFKSGISLLYENTQNKMANTTATLPEDSEWMALTWVTMSRSVHQFIKQNS